LFLLANNELILARKRRGWKRPANFLEADFGRVKEDFTLPRSAFSGRVADSLSWTAWPLIQGIASYRVSGKYDIYWGCCDIRSRSCRFLTMLVLAQFLKERQRGK
jgi:hypothetical protein